MTLFQLKENMTRYERLSDVLQKLGEASGLGYDITPDITSGSMLFDCIEGVDRSVSQSQNPRVVFEIERKNIISMDYQDNDNNFRNVFYSTLSGSTFADEAYTATYTRNDEPLPSGIYRWEQHLDISAQHPETGMEYSELKRLSMIRADSYKTSEAFTASVTNDKVCFGKHYSLGDIVTVQNKKWGVSMDTRVTAITVDGSESGVNHTVTFGDAPLNFSARLRREMRGG